METIPAADLTLIGLFNAADFTVKTVIVLLLGASVWCWSVIVHKSLQLRKVIGSMSMFEEDFWSQKTIDAVFDQYSKNPTEPLSFVFVSGMQEWRHRGDSKQKNALSISAVQRVERVMTVAGSREVARLSQGLTFLATIGSTAPFIGLFGTVWGIMNAFTAIAEQANTSLAIVAPGIAEALLATAVGLFAAIPATMAYNRFSQQINNIGERITNFQDEFMAVLARHVGKS
ncbi:MAG: protein TolQ [Pseudomonadota bacterium]